MIKNFKNNWFLKVILIPFFLFGFLNQNFAQSFAINMGGTEISLLNANRTVLIDPGNNGGYSAGSVHRYDNVITANGITVYAILTVKATVGANIVTGYFDDDTPGTGDAKRFQPRITTTAAGGYVLYELEFHELLTKANVYISDYFLTGVDVDGREFYDIGGYQSYVVDAACILTIGPSPADNSLTRFQGASGDLTNITFENTSAFIAKYPNPSSKIIFSVGNAGTASSRQFSAQFGSLGGTFSSVYTTYNPIPSLTITKSATPSLFSPGANSQYSIAVNNSGNTARNVTLSDVLPAGLTYVPNSTTVSIPASTTNKSFLDNFNTVSYNNQNGTDYWKSLWYEVDDNNAPASGQILISAGKLRFNKIDALDEIARNFDLSAAQNATLTFNWQTTSFGAGSLTIQLTSDVTATLPVYTTVGTISGTGSGNFSYIIPSAYFTANAAIRFMSSSGNWATGNIADIDNVQIAYSYSKPNVVLTNAPGTLANGVPPNLVTATDAIVLEPNVTMTVTFNVAVDCGVTGTFVNTATANCTNLPLPVSASHMANLGPTANGGIVCSTPGSAMLTANGATAGQVYRWYDAASGGNLLYTGNPFTTPNISTNTTYYVAIYTLSSSCEGARVPVIASVSAPITGTGIINELSTKTGTPSGTYSDVQGSVGFSVSGLSGATSYNWTIDYIGATFIGSTTSSTVYVNFNNGGTNNNVQVCVVPSNECGTGTKICKTISISNGVNYEISGFVYNDPDGSDGTNKVDGVGIGSIGGQQLYAILVEGGKTVFSTPVAADGSYKFSYLKNTANNYSIWISTGVYGTGTTPVATLPAGALFSGEINNNAANGIAGNDGTKDGKVINLTATDPAETNVNFGVSLTNPTAVNDNVSTNEDTNRSFYITSNDVPYTGRSISNATVDLDPNTAGRQTTFSSPGQGVFSVDDSGYVTFVPVADYFGTAVMYYIVSDNTGIVSNSAVVTVTINPVNDAPSFTKGANQTVCAGAGMQSISSWATALHSGPANESAQIIDFIVSNNNSSIFSVQPAINSSGTLTFTPHASNSGTATVTVSIHDDGGTLLGGVNQSANQTFTINVNPDAAISLTSSVATNPMTTCLNTAINNITYSISGGGTGASITSGSLPGGLIGSYNSGVFTISGIPTSSGTFNYTITTTGSCTQASVDGVINVQSTPTAGTIAGTQSICKDGDPVAFSSSVSGSGSGAISYRWESSVSPFTTWSPIGSATAPTYDPPSGLALTTHYRRITISTLNGINCESVATNEIVVTVNAMPIVSSPATSVCVGSTITLSPTTGGTWSSSNTLIATVTNAGVVTGVSGGSANFTYNNTSTGCSATTSSILVNALPTFSTSSNNVTCFNAGDGSITITVLSGTPPYQFSIDNGVSYTGFTTSPYTKNQLLPGTYKIRVRDNNGCETPKVLP